MSTKHLCVAVAALGAIAFAVSPFGPASQAQETPAPEPAAPTEPAPADTLPAVGEPAGISSTLIVRSADAAGDTLARIRAKLAPTPAVTAIDTLLPAFADSVRKMSGPILEADLSRMSARDLTDVEQRWRGLESRIQAWLRTLESRTAALDVVNQKVTELRGVWDATADLAYKQDIPPELVDRILTIQDAITEVEATLSSRRDQLLRLESHVSETGSGIQRSIARIDSARAVVRERLLAADSPPIWQVARRGHREFPGEFARSWELRSTSLRDFMDTNQNRLLVHAVFFVALVSFVFTLRRRTRDWDAEDASVQAALHVLGRPIAAALLIALALHRLFYERVPSAWTDLVSFFALLALLRLLPGMLPVALRGSVLGMLGIFAAFRLEHVLIEGSLSHRAALFAIDSLAFVWAARLNQRGIPAELRGSLLWNAYLGLVRFSAVLFVVALTANLFGFLALSTLLTSGILNSVFLSLVLFAAVRVLDGLAVAAVRRGGIRVLRTVRMYPDLVLARVSGVFRLVGIVTFVALSLRQFGVLEAVVSALASVLGAQATLGTWTISLGDVLAFAITIWLAVMVSRVIRFILREDVLSRMRLPRGMPHSVSTMAHYVIVGVGFMFAAGAAGIDLNKFTLLAGAFGVGIGFGLQNIVNNFISGLILTFERPIQIGDTVELDQLIGIVRRIGIRASIVRTFSGAEVIVPNGDLISGRVINWTLSDQLRRIEIPIGVKYGTRPQQVIDILVEVGKKHEQILDTPEPVVLFRGFGESSLDFEMRFWTANFDSWLQVSSQIAAAAYDALNEAGIEIPFPQRDLHIRSVDATAADALAHKEQDKAPQR